MPFAASAPVGSRLRAEAPGTGRALPKLIGSPVSSHGPSRHQIPASSSCQALVLAEVAETLVYLPSGWEPSRAYEPAFRSLNRIGLRASTHVRSCCSTSPAAQPCFPTPFRLLRGRG